MATTQTETVIKAAYSLNNTQGNPEGAGDCIVDATSGDVNIATFTFEITETDDYDVVFGGAEGMVFIHKLDYVCNQYADEPIPGSFPPLTPCIESEFVPIIASSLCLDNMNDSTWEWGAGNYDSRDATNISNPHDKLPFTPGVYQITLFNTADYSTPNSTLSIAISREEDVVSVNSYSTTPAGLRIQRTIDNPGQGQNSIEKTYKYTTTRTGSISSGKVLNNAKLHYSVSNDIVDAQNGNINTIYTLNRVASAAGGNQPHIVYTNVFEIEQNNGYIEHKFNSGVNGLVTMPGPPFSNSFQSDVKVGKEHATNVYNSIDDIVTKQKSSYYNNFLHSQKGFALKQDGTRIFKFSYVEKLNDTTFRRRYVDPSWDALVSVFLGTEGSTPSPQLPTTFCDQPNIECYSDMGLSPLEPVITLASGKAGNMLKSESYSYLTNGVTSQIVDYFYNDDELLQETKTTNSDNSFTSVKNYYTGDFFENGGIHEDMYLENRKNTIVKTETYQNNMKTGTQQTVFNKWGVSYLPEYIQSAKNDDLLENRIQYHSYYTDGNVREVSLKNGTRVVYIWGYDKMYPVAKIENATYTQIIALSSFLANSNGDIDLLSSGLSITQENDLRDNLPSAMISTYTYDPLIGVTSMTDPRGYTMYYEYDEFNRLKRVKDADGHILSENEYHYKNQQE